MVKIAKELLLDLYIKQNKTQKEIAALQNCSAGYICLLLRRFGISKNKTKSVDKRNRPNSEVLANLYDNKSVSAIAKEFNVSKSLVYTWLTEDNVPRKIKDPKNLPELNSIQKEVLLGSLLGDGYITFSENSMSKFIKTQNKPRHKPDRKSYLLWHEEVFGDYSLPLRDFTNNNTLPNGKVIQSKGYVFRTHSHPGFNTLEKAWYLRDKNGNHVLNNSGRRIKIIPLKEIQLSPLALAVWYCDDGSNDLCSKRLVLHTQGFTHKECKFLISELKQDFGIEASYYGGKIRIPTKMRTRFLDVIRPYMIWDCFNYKVEVN